MTHSPKEIRELIKHLRRFGDIAEKGLRHLSDTGWRSYEHRAADALEHLLQSAEWKATHRHLKSGGEYRVIGNGRHSETLDPLTVYQGRDGTIWARPRVMFEDGRFEALPPPVSGSEKEGDDVTG